MQVQFMRIDRDSNVRAGSEISDTFSLDLEYCDPYSLKLAVENYYNESLDDNQVFEQMDVKVFQCISGVYPLYIAVLLY